MTDSVEESYNLRSKTVALKRKNLFKAMWVKNVMRCLELDETTATELFNRIIKRHQ